MVFHDREMNCIIRKEVELHFEMITLFNISIAHGQNSDNRKEIYKRLNR